MACQQGGDAPQAEAMYREAARLAPGHPDVHHLLGLALHQQGRNGEARLEIEAAIKAYAGAAHFHNNLGEVLRASGDPEGAIACYRRALELEPRYPQALNNLGLALHATGRASEARDAFARIVSAHPDSAQAHNNLGIVEQSTGNLEAAVASFRRATELAPEQPHGWNNLGAALQAAGDLDGAGEALERAVALDPQAARVHYNRSRVLAARGDAEAAETSVRRALELDPGEPEFHVQLGFLLRATGRFGESVQALRAALEHAPRHPIAHNDLGVSLLMLGEFEEAEAHLMAAVEEAPGLAVAYENLARARRFGPGDAPLMQRLETLLSDVRISDAARMHLHFALGKMWDDRDEPERAFRHFESANRVAHARGGWDAAARSRHVDRLMAVFDADWFRDRSGFDYGHPSAAPVLIVGMPRSGTTLVEQILASHPKVRACGELEFFANLAAVMPERLGRPQEAYPECARALGASDMEAIARSYLKETFRDPGGAERFTDKNPLNFDHLGLVAVMFPNARIVHVTRDPMDTCLSIYSTHFTRDNAFAYDLDDIARYHRDYVRLMEHWRACLGDRLHEVSYEALVSDQEGRTRALLAYCGLEWDPACLAFHRTRRVVGTASHWQVRQPLYGGAVGRWRRYAPWRADLRDKLEA